MNQYILIPFRYSFFLFDYAFLILRLRKKLKRLSLPRTAAAFKIFTSQTILSSLIKGFLCRMY